MKRMIAEESTMLETSTLGIARLPVLSFLSAYLVTMRPYLLFISGITGIVGMSFAPDLPWSKGVLIFLAAFLSYGFGQALTDCFQTDTDALSAPYRPLTRGIISKTHVLVASLAGLGFCILVFALNSPITVVLGILAALGLATYTPFKRLWWAGPFYNAWIIAVLALMAYLAALGSTPGEMIPLGFEAMLGSVFFGYATFVLSGYFKDVNADRATEYNTLPVAFGRRTSALICDLFATLAIVFTVMAVEEFSIGVAIFVAAGIIAFILGEIRLHDNRQDERAHTAIAPVVHGYILLLSGLACSRQPEWFIPLLVLYGGFVVALSNRTEKNQI
jgi:4-hydroxybenzoate polyprenyltransferase